MVKLYLGNRKPECHGRDGVRKDALMWNTKNVSQQDAALNGVILTLAFEFKVKLNFEGQIVSGE